jgi:predicted phage-related endonuclease
VLTNAQHSNRDGKIGASFLPYLMAGDEAKIINEWRRLVGDPSYEREDLSDVWAVQLGSYLETFVLDWHERKTGKKLFDRQQWFTHPERPFLGCHVDCIRDHDATVIDAKVVGGHRKIDDVLALYMPQMIAQQRCTKTRSAALLVVVGGAEPVEYPVTWEDAYEDALWQRVDAFWACVGSLTPPFPLPAIAAPVKAEKVVDLTGSNSWAAEAACWLATKDAARQFDAATKAIKALVPADAAKAHGYGIAATRNKAGSLSIREIAA